MLANSASQNVLVSGPAFGMAAMSKDTKYLRLHGRSWEVVVAVPRHLKAQFGRSQLVHPLLTDSLTIARRLRGKVVEAFKQEIARANQRHERGLDGPRNPVSADPGVAEALGWRDLMRSDERLQERDNNSIAAALVYNELIEQDARALAQGAGLHAARSFLGIATGTATPLMLHRDEWLSVMAVKPKTIRDRRTTLSLFEAWAKENRYFTVQEINRKVAGDFLAQRLSVAANGRRLDSETINKHLSALGLYWDWLVERGHLGDEPPANPWRKHKTVAALSRQKEEYKREFTDDELSRLLYVGSPDEALADYMLIAALTGMRIAEIGALTVGDCEGDVFNIRKAKTKAGIRKVPIHTALRALVARRSKGRKRDYWLIEDGESDDLRKVPKTRLPTWDRSSPISKRFTRYRQTVGVHEEVEGQVKSAVDFHSFRRWFSTMAERAGIEPHIVQFVIGQKRGSLLLDRYSGGSSVEQMRACVEAVKLPGKKRNS